ncbi:MAG: hypothetical protein OEQ25_13880 [Gammaproteobacteria bacterium]|nr:hypothetical protein [Gammaproteobacteria bacterium]MDH3508218.1 hypothetical protein [Gammaproteobacteria bacterium]
MPSACPRSLIALAAIMALVSLPTGHVDAQSRERPAPDLAGIWQVAGDSDGLMEAGNPPMTAWGRERFALSKPIAGPRSVSATQANAAELTCLPMGFPATYLRPRPFDLIQLPDRIVMLFEVGNFWRVIHMDGRDFPDVPLHTWNGYSIGRYEADALVIETRHMLGWQSEDVQRWVDRLGYPFSDELVLTERLRRIDENTLENVVTIDDPIAYERPWSSVMTFERSEYELSEFICQELMLSELPEVRPGQE